MFTFPLILIDSSTEIVMVNDTEKVLKLEEFKEVIASDELLRKYSLNDDYVKRFLYATSFKIEEALAKLKSLYQLIESFPKSFPIEPPLSRKRIIEENVRMGLLETDRDGRMIYILKMENCNTSKMDFIDLLAVDDVWLEWFQMNSGPNKSLCILIDMEKLRYKCLKWMTPQNINFCIKKLQCLPFQSYMFHVVNNSILVSAFVKIIWPLLPEDMKKLVVFHYDNRKSLHQYIDPQVLPNEYGGITGPLDYNKIYERLYEQNDQIFKSFLQNRSLKENSV